MSSFKVQDFKDDIEFTFTATTPFFVCGFCIVSFNNPVSIFGSKQCPLKSICVLKYFIDIEKME